MAWQACSQEGYLRIFLIWAKVVDFKDIREKGQNPVVGSFVLRI
jgi:hypothetical protein